MFDYLLDGMVGWCPRPLSTSRKGMGKSSNEHTPFRPGRNVLKPQLKIKMIAQ